MAEVTQLTLAVDSRQVRQASQDLDKLSQSGSKTERSVGGLVGAFRALAPAAAAAVGAFAGNEAIRAADTYSNLNARLRLATRSATEFAQAQQEIFAISQRTRSGLEATADLFGSLTRSLAPLGVSQREVLDVTESISQALIVSGASAQSAQAALVQLGQGFASGVLRGEELNSILEQTPRLARAIADGLGVPVGALRQLGEEGELTADKVFRALQKSASSISAEFEQVPLTVGGAITQVSNSLLTLIGVIDQSTGASNSLAQSISDVATFLGDLAQEIKRASEGAKDVGLLAQAFVTVSQSARILLANVVFVFQSIGREIGAIAAQIAALGRGNFREFRAISEAVREDAIRARQELERFQQQVLTPFLNSRGRGDSGFQDPRIIGTTPANETVGFRPTTARTTAPRTGGGRSQREVVSESQRYLENLQRQLEATQNLTVEEALLRDIQLGRLGKLTPQQEIELQSLAAQIDAARLRIDQEKQLTLEIERQQKAEADAAKAAKDRLQAFLDATPTGQLRQQNEELDFLKTALEENKITLEEYAEIVRTRFASSNEQIREQKSLAEDLGLSFTSAFEDAIVSGKGLSEVLRGLEQDIIRIVTRRLVTEPLGNAISGLLGGGISSVLGSIGGAVLGSAFSGAFGASVASALPGDSLQNFLDLNNNFAGRAIGGPVSANRLYRVNEKGPELLSVGGREYLMMGNQGGKVSPNMTGGENRTFNINVTMPQQADRATGLQFGRMIAQQLSIANSRNG